MDIPNALEIIDLAYQHKAEAFMATTAVTTGVAAALAWALVKCKKRVVYRAVSDNEIEDDLGTPAMRKAKKDLDEKERAAVARAAYDMLADMEYTRQLSHSSRRKWSMEMGHKLNLHELLPYKPPPKLPPNPEKVKAKLKNGRRENKIVPFPDKKENVLASMM